ncbi:MAG: gliding motility-associated ABC transporter substrate-binding protein GldG [Paludibacteraceae bacterium]|nr:gliding motility-associated ABC transporter substrate-binding protein GldG [Paludibacteraceae bacterium]
MEIKNIKKIIEPIVVVLVLLLVYFISSSHFFRLDLTEEKRYSISDNTKELLSNLDDKVEVTVYLDGDLNSGFLQLKKATKEMLDEFKVYADDKLVYKFENPSDAKSAKAREKKFADLESRGLRRIPVYDKDAEGNPIMRVIFPWAEIKTKNSRRAVNLLKNVPGRSAEENLNMSAQNLEYELTNALRVLTVKEITKIAFLEGHGELNEAYTYSIAETLREYYQIDYGSIIENPDELDDYAAMIVAGPTQKFSEKDKYVLDQYLMKGGKILWLVDGARVALDSLTTASETASIPLDVNLSDQLFRYGVRINPVLLQDVQCTKIPVNVSREGDQPDFKPAPWYYSPLLLANPYHSVSKGITPVKTQFASSIDFVGDSTKLKKTELLVTSASTHIQSVPSIVSMDIIRVEKSGYYFNRRNQIVAAAIEGEFTSVFKNRMIPQGVKTNVKTIEQSKPTKIIVVADADVIKNDVQGYGENIMPVKLGYDNYMNQQFGNSDFVLNAVNYLTDDSGWMELRGREIKLRLLNKAYTIGQRTFWQVFNVALPLVLLAVFGVIYLFWRKRKYA